MRKTAIAVMVLVAATVLALPATATTTDEQPEAPPGACVKVGIDPPGFHVDPPCIIKYVEDLIDSLPNPLP